MADGVCIQGPTGQSTRPETPSTILLLPSRRSRLALPRMGSLCRYWVYCTFTWSYTWDIVVIKIIYGKKFPCRPEAGAETSGWLQFQSEVSVLYGCGSATLAFLNPFLVLFKFSSSLFVHFSYFHISPPEAVEIIILDSSVWKDTRNLTTFLFRCCERSPCWNS